MKTEAQPHMFMTPTQADQPPVKSLPHLQLNMEPRLSLTKVTQMD
jgi:hypothetical protein